MDIKLSTLRTARPWLLGEKGVGRGNDSYKNPRKEGVFPYIGYAGICPCSGCGSGCGFQILVWYRVLKLSNLVWDRLEILHVQSGAIRDFH